MRDNPLRLKQETMLNLTGHHPIYATDFPYRTAADPTRGVTAYFKGDDLRKG